MRTGFWVLVFVLLLGLAFAQEEIPLGEEEIPEIAVAVEVEAEKEKPAKVDEVPLEKIESMVNLRSVPDVLKRLPGTETYIGPGLAASMPVVRGNDSKWTQVLLEGAILSPVGRPYMLNMMPLTAIESIEVIKGPAPPQYPGSTIGGLVLLTMKSGDKYPGAGAQLTIGSYNRQTYELWSGGGDDEKNYFFSVNKELYSGWRPHQKKNFTEASLKLNFSPDEKSKLTIVGSSLNGVLWGVMQLGPNPAQNWYPEWTIDHRSLASITYKRQVSDKSDYFIRIVPFAFSGQIVIQRKAKPDMPGFYPMKYSLWKEEFQYNIRPNPQTVWTYGAGFQRDVLESTPTLDVTFMGKIPPDKWKKNDLTYKWLFIQNTFLAQGKNAYTLAVRYDSANPGKDIISPFFSTHFPLGSNSLMRFAVTKNRRFADLHELYGEGIFKGNTDLRPETGWTYQLDLEKKLKENSKFTLTLYQTKLDNVIGADASTKNQYMNIGRAKLQGIECEYEKNYPWGLWWANYTYLDAWDLNKDRPLVIVFRTASPRNMFKTGITINGKNNWNFDLELFAYGPRRTDLDTPRQEDWFKWDQATQKWVPIKVTVPTEVGGYAIFNLKLRKATGKDSELILSIENLFDKDYQDLLFYPAPGRWINLSFKKLF
ncbi:TonB-dependent receptor [bacterium]|nr:TonB-dependent receptor [bacterium]